MKRFSPAALVVLLVGGVVAYAIAAEEEFTVYYCMYEEQQCVKPSEQFKPDRSNIPHLAKVVLFETKGNFIGFIDKSDATMQFIVIGPNKIVVDIPDAASNGSFVKTIATERALQIIDEISAPLARYKSELGLEFEKW